MASRRMISNSLGDSEKFSRLKSDTHRLAYVLLVTWADAEGRFLADSVSLRGKLYTRLPWEAGTVEAALLDMHDVELVRLYAAGKHRYGVIVGFHEHNTIRRNPDGTPKEEAPSRYPAPPEEHRSDTGPGGEERQGRHTGVTPEPHRNATGPTQAEVEVEVEVEPQEELPPPTPPRATPEPRTRDEEVAAIAASLDNSAADTRARKRQANRLASTLLSQQHRPVRDALDDLQGTYAWKPNQFHAIAETVLEWAREQGTERTAAALHEVLTTGANITHPIKYAKALLYGSPRPNGQAPPPLPERVDLDLDAIFGPERPVN